MSRSTRLLPVVTLVALLAAPAAQAQERGENITHVKNLPYAEGVSNGTDIEFATIAVSDAKKRSKKRTTKRTFAFAGSYGHGLQIIDVTDPANPRPAAEWDCGVSQGDVQVFQRKDLGGRWFVTYTHDDGYDFVPSKCDEELVAMGEKDPAGGDTGTYIADVTDPYNPKSVSFWPVEQGSHNQTVHPSGRYLYNSNSDLITSLQPAIEIADITDIDDPQTVGEFALLTLPGLGTESHDITFNDDGSRAYVAALSHAEVLDTTDPTAPSRAGVIVDPAINVWHQSDPVTLTDPILGEREFIIVEDEVAGAAGTGQCPNGGVHVYDATGDLAAAPVKVGYWNIDDVGLTENGLGTCTAHVFDIYPEERLMTIAYYNGGVRVVDLSGLVGVALGKTGVGMKQLGSYRFPDSNTWAVKTYTASRDGFYMFANDHTRGFDAYRYEPGGASSASETDTWMSAAEHTAALQKFATSGGELSVAALCLLSGGLRGETDRAASDIGLSLPAGR